MVNQYPLALKDLCENIRNWNLCNSIMSQAFIRMGDLLYEGQGYRQKDFFSAAEMYTEAALRNDPQVCFL